MMQLYRLRQWSLEYDDITAVDRHRRLCNIMYLSLAFKGTMSDSIIYIPGKLSNNGFNLNSILSVKKKKLICAAK